MELLFIYWVISILIIWFSIDEKMNYNTELMLLFAPIYLLALIGKALKKYHDI
jgi:hypothetical protein